MAIKHRIQEKQDAGICGVSAHVAESTKLLDWQFHVLAASLAAARAPDLLTVMEPHEHFHGVV